MHNLFFPLESQAEKLLKVSVMLQASCVVERRARKGAKTRRSCARIGRPIPSPTLLLGGDVVGEEILADGK